MKQQALERLEKYIADKQKSIDELHEEGILEREDVVKRVTAIRGYALALFECDIISYSEYDEIRANIRGFRRHNLEKVDC